MLNTSKELKAKMGKEPKDTRKTACEENKSVDKGHIVIFLNQTNPGAENYNNCMEKFTRGGSKAGLNTEKKNPQT